MSDDGAEAASDNGDFDDKPPEPGDMQIALFRDFLDWRGAGAYRADRADTRRR